MNLPVDVEQDYEIYLPWLISETLLITSNEDTLQIGKFSWIDTLQTLFIENSIFSNFQDSLRIRYRSAKITDEIVYQVYEPIVKIPDKQEELDGTVKKNYTRLNRRNKLFGDWKGLHKQGSISRGVKFGDSDGDISSGLFLTLSGQPSKDIFVDAIIDDRDIPSNSTGGASTLAELDRILIRIQTPFLDAELGDWKLDWNDGNFGHLRRQLKGARISSSSSSYQVEGAAAGGDNVFQSQSFHGRAGDFGPYELTDKSGNPGIVVLAGSERVFLNGKRLKKGRNNEYIMDYSSGSLTFTPSVIIYDNSRIEIDFQYNEGNYPHYLYSSKAGLNYNNNPRFKVMASVVNEGLDKDNPLAFTWTKELRDLVGKAGDNPEKAFMSGVDSVGTGEGDYILNEVNNKSILSFSPPDDLGHPTGNRNVYFEKSEIGDYNRIYDSDLQTFYFVWVGEGIGEWNPVRTLSLPEKHLHFDLITEAQMSAFTFQSEIASSHFDRNSMSVLDDDDNSGLAWNLKGGWGEEKSDPFFIQISTKKIESRYKALEKDNPTDFIYKWNIEDVSLQTRMISEIKASVRPARGLKLFCDAGLLENGPDFGSERFTIGENFSLNRWKIQSTLSGINTEDKQNLLKTSRQNIRGSIEKKFNKILPQYSVNSEHNNSLSSISDSSNFRIDHQFWLKTDSIYIDKIDLGYNTQSDVKEIKGEKQRISSSGTYQMILKDKISQSGGFNLSLQRSETQYFQDLKSNKTATTTSLNTHYTPWSSPWRVRSDYYLSTGNGRTSLPVAIFVGQNNGSHRREGNRYVPDPDGDFILGHADADTLQAQSTIEFDSRVNWSLPKSDKKGIKEDEKVIHLESYSTHFSSRLTTTKKKPWRSFFFHPAEYKAEEATLARFNLTQYFDLAGKNAEWDSRISMKIGNERDRLQTGGEESTNQEYSIRYRKNLTENLNARIEPSVYLGNRSGMVDGRTRSKIFSSSIENEMILKLTKFDLDLILGFSYIARKDRFLIRSVIERDWQANAAWHFNPRGQIRADIEYIVLSTSIDNPGYDLDRGWESKNNYKLRIDFDYKVHSHINFIAYYRGLWKGLRKPRHDGLLEMTVTL